MLPLRVDGKIENTLSSEQRVDLYRPILVSQIYDSYNQISVSWRRSDAIFVDILALNTEIFRS